MPADLPQKARFVIRVGVTGHRILEQHGFRDVDSLRARARELVVDLGQLAHRLYERRAELGERWMFREEKPLLRVTTALAMGADQIVAEEAIRAAGEGALGVTELELALVLPATHAEYRKSSTFEVRRPDPNRAGQDLNPGEVPEPRASAMERDALARYDSLHQHPLVKRVTELDGWTGGGTDEDAYASLADLMLGQVDALIAIWDCAQGGRGGTAYVVGAARDLGIPVSVLRPTPSGAVEVELRKDSNPIPAPPALGTFRDCALVAAVADATLFPAVPSRHGIPGRSTRKPLGVQIVRRGDLRTEYFASEVRPTSEWHRTLWWLSGRWAATLRLLARRRASRQSAAILEVSCPLHPNRYWFAFREADALAGYNAGLYRLAFTVLAGLGALAVCFALFGLSESAGSAGSEDAATWPVVMEFLVILAMLVLFGCMYVSRWHKKSVDYRLLAELFRQMEFLSPLGLTPSSTRPLVAYEEGRIEKDWTNRHFRAVVRELGAPPQLCLLPEYLRERWRELEIRWIEDQHAYHEQNARRFHVMHLTLEILAIVFFSITLILCILHLMHVEGPSELAIPFLCALFPALAAACHAISTQGELRRISRRSEAMTKTLEGLKEQMGSVGAHPSWRSVAKLAQDASRAMLEETLDWRVLLLNHPPHPPG